MPNPVVHFEIIGQDAEALQQYYRDLFGWSLAPMAPDVPYGLVRPEETGSGIGGGVGANMAGGAMVTVYVQVDDIQAALDRAAERWAARSSSPPTVIPGTVTFALFKDIEGNIVGPRRLGDAAGGVRRRPG